MSEIDPLSGKLNKYTCNDCHKDIYTRDSDKGTTPFMIGCRASSSCDGTMFSSFYRLPFLLMATKEADYIWRKPTHNEYRKAHHELKHHFDLGGLTLQKVENPSLLEGE